MATASSIACLTTAFRRKLPAVLCEKPIEKSVLISHIADVVTMAGKDCKLDVPAAGPHGIDHRMTRIQRHNCILVAVKCPDWQTRQLRCLFYVSTAG